MARLCSVSCGPLPVFLLLLLASVPAMAAFSESGLEALQHFGGKVEKAAKGLFDKKAPQAVKHFPLGAENVPDEVGGHLVRGIEKLTPYALRKMNAPEDFINGVKRGFKTCKFLKKISKLLPEGDTYTVATIPTGGTADMQLPILTVNITATDGLCGPDVAVGLQPAAPSWAVVGFGNGGELSQTFPKFSYRVKPDGTAAFWLGESSRLLPTTIPLYTNPPSMYPRDGRYYVQVTGIRVGVDVETPTELGFRPDGTGGVYLSTTEPYTYLERLVYGRLKATLMSRIEKLNPEAVAVHTQSSAPQDPAAGQLCYIYNNMLAEVPSMAFVFAGNAVMKIKAANVWYRQGPYTCLAILPSSPGQASIIGSWMQTDMVMTIDVTPGVQSTLTF